MVNQCMYTAESGLGRTGTVVDIFVVGDSPNGRDIGCPRPSPSSKRPLTSMSSVKRLG